MHKQLIEYMNIKKLLKSNRWPCKTDNSLICFLQKYSKIYFFHEFKFFVRKPSLIKFDSKLLSELYVSVLSQYIILLHKNYI